MRGAFAEGMLSLNMNQSLPSIHIKNAEERTCDTWSQVGKSFKITGLSIQKAVRYHAETKSARY